MNRRVAVRAVVLHEGKLLCVQHKRRPGKPVSEKGSYWCLPGGGVDAGEPLLPALKREMVEELGVEPTIGNLLYIQQFVDGDIEHMDLFFHVTNAEDYLHVDLSKTTHGAIEIDAVSFIDPAADYVLPRFLATEPLAEHIATNQSVKVFNNISL